MYGSAASDKASLRHTDIVSWVSEQSRISPEERTPCEHSLQSSDATLNTIASQHKEASRDDDDFSNGANINTELVSVMLNRSPPLNALNLQQLQDTMK